MSTIAERRELATTVRAALSRFGDRAVLRRAIDGDIGYDEQLWRVLCEQVGVAALAVPEEYGGVGAGLAESLIVVEELGRTLHTPPMLGSAVLGVWALLLSGDIEACARLLPGVAEGGLTLAVCWADSRGWDGFGVRVVDGKLSGTAHYVLDGDAADTLVVVTAAGVYEIDAGATGVTRRVAATMDVTRRLWEIGFDSAPARVLAGDGTTLASRLRDIAWVALAAEQVGAADYCLGVTVEYTGSRVQFGRPIGGFQALKHRMADLYVLVESARSVAYSAIAGLESGDRLAGAEVAAARIHCTEVFRTVAGEMIQLHGGIAITWEHDAHLFFKRAHADGELFGVPVRPVARTG
ncbi:acyl-CoA dehydrogenase family protein [Nocardia aurantia]|uniref:Putative acyl-CoA dehydrogenase fadE25 n=1 Tax=Nocardia aurantia TaxID=2585199 RepID=A0A7K0DFK8_9NOCA|nr:acyl-CoA dehydrogenase family protein [Nocardia aurantia]MQY24566.1 putative acyl-CoA dehydrogenase fadE25 [Nocardia aurantia]